jgi:hypothetical protein
VKVVILICFLDANLFKEAFIKAQQENEAIIKETDTAPMETSDEPTPNAE